MPPANPPGRLALLVGGGPAPGLNGVISSVTIEAIEQNIEVIGFQDGFKWLVRGDAAHHRRLTIEDVKGIYPRGGSVLGTSRTNPAKSEEHMHNVLETLRRLNVTMLVTIGGDDTAFSGSQVYLRAGGAVRVAHVPKTIDNDLPLPGSAPTFGYETARQVGVGIVRNLAEDARTTSRWYLIVSMGRAAGHLALGIGKAAAATLTIIPEEFRSRRISIDDVCDILIGSIVKRRSANLHHGVAILAEGLIEAIGEEGLEAMVNEGQIGRYGSISRDDHGHLRLGDIDFGRMMKDALSARLREMGLEVAIIDKELGYELRCADPIPFDAEYTRDLGYGAVHFVMSDEAARYGAVISLEGGRLKPIRFEDMINPETRRMKPRKVDVDGESYRCARAYMIRLEPRDLAESARLGRLAEAANMAPGQFRQRFAKVVAHG
jgi:6-phosphofructokinase 1